MRCASEASATIFLSDFTIENDIIEGTWRVEDDGTTFPDGMKDNDFVGFVFGYQELGKFYLFDWKKEEQENSGSIAKQGMSVKIVNITEPFSLADFWNTEGDGSRVRTLFHNDTPWENFTDYQFSLEFHPGEFTITVRQGEVELLNETILDDTYQSGGFGFYNYSQGLVEYQGFIRKELAAPTYSYDVNAIDPDDDPNKYTLTVAPDGMTIDDDTGLITWAPREEDLTANSGVGSLKPGSVTSFHPQTVFQGTFPAELAAFDLAVGVTGFVILQAGLGE